jgi:phytoene/squalene synthetase
MLTLPASITKSASRQTYYTIRFLVDRGRVEDAYRAYGYFRWVDDVLDAPGGSKAERTAFLARQKSILAKCYQDDRPPTANPQEKMLVELIQHDPRTDGGLHAYLRNLMRVMEFDTRRRGQLISQSELDDYTRWLATAVTEAMHYFIGHGCSAPHDATRYLAVSAAHITHMLRDTYDDLQAGYFNVPREVLEAHRIGPQDVQSDAYRAWVRSRVLLARDYFKAGSAYFARVQSLRHRLAGLAYTSRFAWLLDTIEQEGYRLRPQYSERRSPSTGLRMSWLTLTSVINLRKLGAPSQPAVSRRTGRL